MRAIAVMRGAFAATAVGALLACGGGGGIDTSGPNPSSTFTLSIAGNGTGAGRVKSADGKIDCALTSAGGGSGTCSATYSEGAVVQLTATATDSSQEFVGWTGDCVGGATQSCQITISKNSAVRVDFRPATQELLLRLQTPNTDDGALLLTITGPSLVAIVPGSGIELTERRDTTAGTIRSRVLVRGALSNGIVAQVVVSGAASASQFTAKLDAVAARASGRYAQRPLTNYALTLR